MEEPFNTRLGWTRRIRTPHAVPGDSHLRLYSGRMSGHPIGLLVVTGMFWVAFGELPEARVFALFTLVVGSLVGFALWLKHR